MRFTSCTLCLIHAVMPETVDLFTRLPLSLRTVFQCLGWIWTLSRGERGKGDRRVDGLEGEVRGDLGERGEDFRQ